MFLMQWVLEALLEMNESPGSLDQSFEIVCIRGFGLQPELLEHIVRFVISCFIPAMEKRAIKWMFHDVFLARVNAFNTQVCYEPRNPLAFVHEGFNLATAQMMSKPARTSFPETQGCLLRVADLSQPVSLRQNTK